MGALLAIWLVACVGVALGVVAVLEGEAREGTRAGSWLTLGGIAIGTASFLIGFVRTMAWFWHTPIP